MLRSLCLGAALFLASCGMKDASDLNNNPPQDTAPGEYVKELPRDDQMDLTVQASIFLDFDQKLFAKDASIVIEAHYLKASVTAACVCDENTCTMVQKIDGEPVKTLLFKKEIPLVELSNNSSIEFTVPTFFNTDVQVSVSGLAADGCNTAGNSTSFNPSQVLEVRIDSNFVQTEMACLGK